MIATKVIALFLTLAANLAAGAIIFIFMLIAMNGFSESDAGWGLGLFIVLTLGIAVFTGFLTVLGVDYLIRKSFSKVMAIILPVILCTIAGVIAEMISSLIGIAVADFVRRNY